MKLGSREGSKRSHGTSDLAGGRISEWWPPRSDRAPRQRASDGQAAAMEIFAEDFRREVGAIKSPVARRLYVLSSLNQLTHLRIGEYIALVGAAEHLRPGWPLF